MAHISEISWHVTPFRAQRWIDLWEPAAEKATDYGAESWQIYRSIEDPLVFRQVSVWNDKKDFEAWWYSEEVSEYRAQIVDLYVKPLLPIWCTPIASS
ncbi:MAG: antibiotic biosynthesis monooxygenase [Solirubrobacterales bacterium]